MGTDNHARLEEVRFAIENNIPILPIAVEKGLEERFDKLVGKYHIYDIEALQKDYDSTTDTSTKGKFKDFLDSIFLGASETTKIFSEFDAQIFLSYRKKTEIISKRQ